MAGPGPLSRFWEWGKNIVCVGRNYADHVREMRGAPPREPLLFLKPSSAYAPPGSPARLPAYCRCLHHELELGVVLGRRARAVPEAAAMRCVAGYALGLDMTARDVQDACREQGLPWTLAKGFSGSCPVSAFVPRERVPDPHALRLWLRVNGELRQQGETAAMIFSVPFLISYISRIITLEEGDLILTGTPSGVGPVAHGDEMEAGIEGVVGMRVKVERSAH
ncbi:oxaloacetate tautomerase FAHD1, mitochondrial-like [Dipodomys merriami]|uniref:oxaloacetate tautomerase FAHD1, mitochondrial-like n=1 Tax=Dipodomys merriami TaxID=94247 RepID=UPI003855D0DC